MVFTYDKQTQSKTSSQTCIWICVQLHCCTKFSNLEIKTIRHGKVTGEKLGLLKAKYLKIGMIKT